MTETVDRERIARRPEWTADALMFEVTELVQLYRHREDNSVIGDCFRTAIACLIGAVDPEAVPHFCEQTIRAGLNEQGGWEDIAAARRWLRETHDLDLLMVARGQADALGIAYMLTVKSRAGDWNHEVIGRHGEVIWDPAGVGGYSMADEFVDEPVGIITEPYRPDPDEMLRRWRAAGLEDQR